MAFTFEGQEYGSKAAVVKSLYDNGEITLTDVPAKKALADKLGCAVQSVHAAILNRIKATSNVSKPSGKGHVKVTPAVEQAVATAKNRSKGKAIFIDDKTPDVQIELRKDPNKIKVTWAPNQWGIPVCNPPLEVIDKNYDPNWTAPAEEQVEGPWEH